MNGLVFLSDISKVYRSRRREVIAVDRVTLGLSSGQIVCLVGESGSGKSTIGRIVTGLTGPTAGDLRYGGVSAGSMSRRNFETSRLSVQLIHQDPYASLNPGMTVGATLAAPLKRHQGLSGSELSHRISTLLEDVGLTPSGLFEPKLPHELSGGQRQRVVIARALTVDPKVLVADEALSMLDVSIRMSVLQMLRRLCEDRDLAVLFITHDLAVARQFGEGHTVAVMQHGRIVEHRDTAALVADPEHDYTKDLLRAARHEGLRSRRSSQSQSDPASTRERRRAELGSYPTSQILRRHERRRCRQSYPKSQGVPMSRTKLRAAALGLTVGALASLVACTGDADTGNTDKESWTKEAGTLELISAEQEAQPPGEVAEGTKFVITVNLKDDIGWSDGTPLTSHDFVGLYDVKWAQQDPVWESLTDVHAPTDTTLVFETRDLSPNLMQSLVRWNQPASSSQFGEIYAALGELRGEGVAPDATEVASVIETLEGLKPERTVAYGPYVVDPSSVTAQQMTMVKNEHGYNADRLAFDQVDVVWGSTQQTVPLLLQNQLDYTTDAFTPTDVQALSANENIEFIRSPLSTGTGIWFNETIEPFDDKRFRQAIALIIDRERNAKVALGDAAKPIEHMVGFSDNYVGDWLSEEVVTDLNPYHRDLDAAQDLLTEVGFTQSGDSWSYGGDTFGFEITAPSDFPDFLASAKDVSAQLNEFGFDTHVRGIPSANRPDTIEQGRYEVMLDFSMTSTPSHPATSLNWNMAEGYFGTNNPESTGSKGLAWPWEQTAPDGTEVYIPDLLEEAVEGMDVAPQKAAVETLAQIFNDQLPVVPIFERYTTDPIAHGPRVTGWLPKDHPVYQNNQGSDPYVSIQFLEGVLKPVEGGDGTFRTSAPYAQPPNFSWNYYGANSMYFTMTSPSYDIAFPPLFWYSAAERAYVPSVGESYSVAEVD